MDWKTWCWLCGNPDAILRPNDEQVNVMFQLTETIFDDSQLCLECVTFLNNCSDVTRKFKKIQLMFEEILLEPTTSNLNAIREKYELMPIIEENDIEDKTEGESMILYEEENEDYQEEYIIEEHLEDQVVEEVEKSTKPTRENIERLYIFKCHVCCEEFPKMQQLSTHCKSTHNEAPLVECVCGKILSSWKRLMDHRARHLRDENEYKCTDCKLSYKTSLAYQKHIEKKHGDCEVNKFECKTCGRNFKDKQVLKNHEKTHLPDDQKLRFPCFQCDKKFINNHCRKIHIARVHEKVSFFFCEHCGKGCTTKSDLLWHMDKHTQERNFECKICYLKFKSTNSLRIHQRRHEAVEATKKCEICNKQFRSTAALSNHKLVHSSEKKYQCQFCPNSYKRLEALKCHTNAIHRGVRPFKCPWCERTFVNAANCRKHKLKEHPKEVAEYESIHGKRGVSLAIKM